MCPALGVIDVIAESKDIFMELIHILKGGLHRDSLALAGKIDNVVENLLGLVHILDKADDSVRLMKFQVLRLLSSPVLKHDGESRIQVGRLVKPALDLLLPEPRLVKDCVIGQEIDDGARSFCLSHNRKQPVLQLDHRIPTLVPVLINAPRALNPDG